MKYAAKLWEFLALSNYHFEFSKILPNCKNCVLNYHSVSKNDTKLFGNVPPSRFRQDLKFLRGNYNIVDLPCVLSNPTEDKKQIAITFDDGYENFYTNVVPILKEFDMPATVFVNPCFTGNTNRDLILDAHALTEPSSQIIMNHSQIQELVNSDLIAVGNHTASHSDLSTIDSSEKLRREIIEARNMLETKFGFTVDRFSYPYGRYSDAALDIVARSHDYAAGTSRGLLTSDTEPHRIPRIDAHGPEHVIRWEMTDVGQRLRDIYDRTSL